MTLPYEWWPYVLVSGMAMGAALVVGVMGIAIYIETRRIEKKYK